MEKGYDIKMKNGYCNMEDDYSYSIARLQMSKNRMFPLKLKNVSQPGFATMVKDDTWLWHLRLGHLNFNGMKLLYQKNMMNGLPSLEQQKSICRNCVIGKQRRDSFPLRKSKKAKYPLKIVRSDICGLITPYSFGKKIYFITFSDDNSRKSCVYFLVEKPVALEVFKTLRLPFKSKVVIISRH